MNGLRLFLRLSAGNVTPVPPTGNSLFLLCVSAIFQRCRLFNLSRSCVAKFHLRATDQPPSDVISAMIDIRQLNYKSSKVCDMKLVKKRKKNHPCNFPQWSMLDGWIVNWKKYLRMREVRLPSEGTLFHTYDVDFSWHGLNQTLSKSTKIVKWLNFWASFQSRVLYICEHFMHFLL